MIVFFFNNYVSSYYENCLHGRNIKFVLLFFLNKLVFSRAIHIYILFNAMNHCSQVNELAAPFQNVPRMKQLCDIPAKRQFVSVTISRLRCTLIPLRFARVGIGVAEFAPVKNHPLHNAGITI